LGTEITTAASLDISEQNSSLLFFVSTAFKETGFCGHIPYLNRIMLEKQKSFF